MAVHFIIKTERASCKLQNNFSISGTEAERRKASKGYVTLLRGCWRDKAYPVVVPVVRHKGKQSIVLVKYVSSKTQIWSSWGPHPFLKTSRIQFTSWDLLPVSGLEPSLHFTSRSKKYPIRCSGQLAQPTKRRMVGQQNTLNCLIVVPALVGQKPDQLFEGFGNGIHFIQNTHFFQAFLFLQKPMK